MSDLIMICTNDDEMIYYSDVTNGNNGSSSISSSSDVTIQSTASTSNENDSDPTTAAFPENGQPVKRTASENQCNEDNGEIKRRKAIASENENEKEMEVQKEENDSDSGSDDIGHNDVDISLNEMNKENIYEDHGSNSSINGNCSSSSSNNDNTGIDKVQTLKKKRVKKVVDPNPFKRERTIPMGSVGDETHYEFTFRMLLRYLELHGNMLVPGLFEVPWIDSWPEETWGKKLGLIVSKIRRGLTFKDKKVELIAAGFQYDDQKRLKNVEEKREVNRENKKRVSDSDSGNSDAEMYKEASSENGNHGGSSSSSSSSSSNDNNNSSSSSSSNNSTISSFTSTGDHKGNTRKDKKEDNKGAADIEVKVRKPHLRKKYVNKIADPNPGNRVRTVPMGPVGEETPYDYILRALLKYQELHGNMLVPCLFAVPWIDSWPEEMWGKKLGVSVASIRKGLSFKENKEELTVAGFQFDCQSKALGWDIIKQLLETYKTVNGNLIIPKTFVVPRTIQWVEDLWGIKLGYIQHNIRNIGNYKEHSEELRAMGFRLKD